MPSFAVTTAAQRYDAIVERGCLAGAGLFLPKKRGKIFVVTTKDVWELHGSKLAAGLAGCDYHVIFFPGGEERKRMAAIETMAEEMVASGGDRSSVVVAFGGGIVTDLGGFLAAIFMRGIPVIQAPTTLLAQVDAGVGGKTGANLVSGKNLIGAFHQPLAVLTDPDVLSTLPEREYRAGIYEVMKCGIIASESLYRLMRDRRDAALARDPAIVDEMIAESVRIKCEVVSADEKEGGLRRMLNFGHTVGHAIEAETAYSRYLHGEAVALGMVAAAHLSRLTGRIDAGLCGEMVEIIRSYGPVPDTAGLDADRILPHLVKDKKAVQGAVHFVLATSIGTTEVVSGLDVSLVREATALALQ